MKEDHIKNWTNHSQALSGWHLVFPTELAFHWAPSKQGSNINDNSNINTNPFSLSVETNGESDEAKTLGQDA